MPGWGSDPDHARLVVKRVGPLGGSSFFARFHPTPPPRFGGSLGRRVTPTWLQRHSVFRRCRISTSVTRGCQTTPNAGKSQGLGGLVAGAPARSKSNNSRHRAAESAASNRAKSRRGTHHRRRSGHRVTTSPRAAPPASVVRFFGVLGCLPGIRLRVLRGPAVVLSEISNEHRAVFCYR